MAVYVVVVRHVRLLAVITSRDYIKNVSVTSLLLMWGPDSSSVNLCGRGMDSSCFQLLIAVRSLLSIVHCKHRMSIPTIWQISVIEILLKLCTPTLPPTSLNIKMTRLATHHNETENSEIVLVVTMQCLVTTLAGFSYWILFFLNINKWTKWFAIHAFMHFSVHVCLGLPPNYSYPMLCSVRIINWWLWLLYTKRQRTILYLCFTKGTPRPQTCSHVIQASQVLV